MYIHAYVRFQSLKRGRRICTIKVARLMNGLRFRGSGFGFRFRGSGLGLRVLGFGADARTNGARLMA